MSNGRPRRQDQGVGQRSVPLMPRFRCALIDVIRAREDDGQGQELDTRLKECRQKRLKDPHHRKSLSIIQTGPRDASLRFRERPKTPAAPIWTTPARDQRRMNNVVAFIEDAYSQAMVRLGWWGFVAGLPVSVSAS